jgi:chromosome segregation ATPase
MVLDKLDSLETSLSKVLEELAHLRRSREELQAEVGKARTETQSAVETLRGREQELITLREENERFQREHSEVRSRVEQILSQLPQAQT